MFFGRLFTLSYFDNHQATFRLLTSRSDAIAYVALLFAVQIPVFILLLERMASLGYIRRLILPSIIRFREVLASYIILSLLLLLSTRASYYYFPVIALTLLSLYVIFIAVRVVFDQRKLKNKEDKFVRKTVDTVFSDRLKTRTTSNDFFERLKKLKRVTHSFMDMGRSDETTKTLDIRTSKEGLIASIDTEQLNDLITQHFSSIITEDTNTSEEEVRSIDILPRLIIAVRPGATVKGQDSLMRLVIPNKVETPNNRFINKLRRCVKIEGDIADSPDARLGELTTDFKQQLRDAIDKDNVVAIQQSLEFYRLLLEGLSNFSKTVADSGYTFVNARQEFHQFMGDSVSEQISSISDVLNDELFHAIREEKRDTTKELASFIYNELLRASHRYDTLKAAFADNSMVFALNRLIFTDSPTQEESPFRYEIFDYLVVRLKEHTDLMLYNFRNKEEDDSNITKKELEQWLQSRIDDTRGFLLATYKKSEAKMFEQLLQVLNEFEDDYRLHEDEVKNLVLRARCSLFLIAAYMHERSSESEAQKLAREAVDVILARLSALDLTELLIMCVDENFADKWRVDTYDLVADGQMHSVPDYNMKLKALWADYMLRSGNFSTDIRPYESLPLSTTQTFSDGMSKIEDAYLVKHLDELLEKNKPKAQELQKLVKDFIDARRKWEEETLIASKISTAKVKKFRDAIFKGYKERSFAMQFFNKAKKTTFVNKANSSYLMFGWNQVYEKAAFIEDWHMGYYIQSEEYGSQIATRQNEIIAEKLLDNPIKTMNILDWLSRLHSGAVDRWMIISIDVGSWFVHSNFEKYLVKSKSYNDIYFKKVKQLAPMEHIYNDNLPKGLYAVRVRHLGKINIKGTREKPVDVAVDAYSHDKNLLDMMLQEPPKWLADKGTKAEQERFLKARVRMYINQAFMYEPAVAREVFYLPMDEDI